MNYPKLVAVVGAAVTSFLVVGAVTIEAVTVVTGGDIGPGIIGVLAGVVAGSVGAWAVQWRWVALAEGWRALLLAYGSVGLTLVFLAFLSYINTPGVDEFLGFQRNLAVAVTVAIVAAAGYWRWGQSGAATPAN